MNGRSTQALVPRATDRFKRDRFKFRRSAAAFAAPAAVMLAACMPAQAQFDAGDLPTRVPPTPPVSIYDTLSTPDRSPQGTSRESLAPVKDAQGTATPACQARDANVAEFYTRADAALKQKDPTETAYWLKSGFITRLEPDDGWALNRLGLILISSDNPKRDPVAARIFWELAATTGNGEALNNLGYLFETGEGVQADSDKALAWYEKAQAAGYVKAAEAIRRMRSKR